MKAVVVANYLKSEHNQEALLIKEEQSLDFVHSYLYKVRKRRKTV